MTVAAQELIQLGQILLESPLKDEYASSVTSPVVLQKWTEYAIKEVSDLPSWRLYRLTRSRFNTFVSAVAANKNTPPDAIKALYETFSSLLLCAQRFVDVIYAIATNPSTPPDILDRIARSKSYPTYIKEAVARNPNVEPPTLEYLSLSKSIYIRAAVASNPKLPLTALQRLAKSKPETVLMAVAKNPNTPLPVLAKLLRSFRSTRALRATVINHPNFPREWLDIVCHKLIKALECGSYPLNLYLSYKNETWSFYAPDLFVAVAVSPRISRYIDSIAERIFIENFKISTVDRISIALALLSNPTLDARYISTALFDENETVRKKAAEILLKRQNETATCAVS
jgi:hypothetical protein